MKIYTRTGDDGSTGLIGGLRVDKADARIECVGNVDELSAALGMAAVVAGSEIAIRLQSIQHLLLVIGARLADPGEKSRDLPRLGNSATASLESQIDAAEWTLPTLTQFILPGGNELSARLHLARAVCRRAERALVELARSVPIDPEILTYINRLSDWLFVMARKANHDAGIADVPWIKP